MPPLRSAVLAVNTVMSVRVLINARPLCECLLRSRRLAGAMSRAYGRPAIHAAMSSTTSRATLPGTSYSPGLGCPLPAMNR